MKLLPIRLFHAWFILVYLIAFGDLVISTLLSVFVPVQNISGLTFFEISLFAFTVMLQAFLLINATEGGVAHRAGRRGPQDSRDDQAAFCKRPQQDHVQEHCQADQLLRAACILTHLTPRPGP